MNAKKKNKKANKPPNPIPPQNMVVAPNREEIVPETKCEVKEENVVIPKISSEILTAAAIDVQELKKNTESETPKKPKRNKGKKSKQEKEEELVKDEQGESKKCENEPNIKVSKPVQQQVHEETIGEKKKGLEDDSLVVPSARKKKNKKKNQEEPKQELKHFDEAKSVPLSPPLPPSSEEPKADSAGRIDSEIQELFAPKPETTKQDNKKNKNKKKNRTDSEKSDKSDKALSCTSAFKTLIVEDQTLSSLEQSQADLLIEDNQEPITIIPVVTESETTKSAPPISETQPLQEIKEATVVESESTKGHSKDEPKTKNKNKNQKKQHQKNQAQDNVTTQDNPIKVSGMSIPKVYSDEPKIDENVITKMQKGQQEAIESTIIPHDLTLESELKIEEESSPKPKAKIAKPVEKKRKGKCDSQSLENLSRSECSEVTEEGKKDVELTKKIENILEDISTDNKFTSDVSNQTIPLEAAVATISIPCDSSMGKKRKKSPKPTTKKSDLKVDIVHVVQKPQSHPVETSEIRDVLSEVIQPEIIISSSRPAETSTKPLEIPPLYISKSKTDTEIDSSDTKLLERAITPDTKRDDEGFEIKTSKKKKKTPKLSQVNITSEIRDLSTPEISKTEEIQQASKQTTEENINVPIDEPSPDLEVRTVRTDDSEASSCDLIPEVLFIRSSSQNLDDNNNTVIQEIMFVEDTKISDSLIIPTIEGSGETPTCTPELVSSGIRLIEFEPKSPTEEKTDIKSKMMEVNQDMEELRLSIERSLAEFKSLEKGEEEQEAKFEANQSAIKERSPLKKIDPEPTTAERQIESDIKENIPTDAKIKESHEEKFVASTELCEPSKIPPTCPTRKDNKGKSKNRKKGKQETASPSTIATSIASSDSTTTQPTDTSTTQSKEEKQDKTKQKSDKKSESSQNKGKQQSTDVTDADSKDCGNKKQPICPEIVTDAGQTEQHEFEPIENFEDALTSSVDDLNKTFELIAKQADDDDVKSQKKLAANKPAINIIEPTEDTDTNRDENVNPVLQPKNLLGHPDIPVQSNRTDYKKEKNKTPNERQATVKIKDSTEVETNKQSKESQTVSKKVKKNANAPVKESFTRVKNDDEEYVYKYSFRKVFLQSACHVCCKELGEGRVPCGYCALVFYCGARHRDDDWPLHQALCFAVSTLAHIKGQEHVYADAARAAGQDYRLLRLQVIVSCEKVLKRRLVPWEQEALLYPRLCADAACREWRQDRLRDCDGCGQVSYCAAHPEHLPRAHARWCKSYSLYCRLVAHQQLHGRLDPPLPTNVTSAAVPPAMNEALAALYEERLELSDVEYAALTQLATAPLTAARALQLARGAAPPPEEVCVHVVGAELQHEADALRTWERFVLHQHGARVLRVVLVGAALNPARLPLDLLARTRVCERCRRDGRRLHFRFEDKQRYADYRASDRFIDPDIICAFNQGIHRSSLCGRPDPWAADVAAMVRLRRPLALTAPSLGELRRDVARVRELAPAALRELQPPAANGLASVRPDRNFISDDEMPLLFKNYCVAVLVGC